MYCRHYVAPIHINIDRAQLKFKVPSHYLPSTYPCAHMENKAKVHTFIYIMHYMWQLSSSTWIPLNSKCQHFNYVIYMALIHINMDRI